MVKLRSQCKAPLTKTLTTAAIHVPVLFMSSAAEMTERHGRVLAELGELGLSLARDLHGRAKAAKDDAAAERMALAFHRVSRAVRMTLALEARLARERRLDWREDGARATHQGKERKAQVRAALARAVLSEAEGEAAETLLEAMDERLGEAAMADDFSEHAVEVHVARIRAELGLAAHAPANDAGPHAQAPAPRPSPSPSFGPPTPPDAGQGPEALNPHPAWQAAAPPGGWLG